MKKNTLRLLVTFFSLLFPINVAIPKDNDFKKDIFKLQIVVEDKKFPEKLGNSISHENKISYAIVTASYLNLRSSPSIKKNIIKVLPKGTHLITLSDNFNGWIKVKLPNNFVGWVSKDYLRSYLPKSLPFFKSENFYKSFLSILEASIIEYMNEIYSKNQLNKKDKLYLVIQDLESEEFIASIRPRTLIKSASTIKVPILHAYLIERFRGVIKESPWHKKLIEEMIRYSSNPSTNTIINLLGGINNVQKLLNHTQIYRELRLIEYFPVNGRAYRNKISVADLNRIFFKIWFKLISNKKAKPKNNHKISKEMLHLLGLQGHAWIKDRIKAKTCFASEKLSKIWDKTGFVKGANGNAGIVEIDTPNGRKAYSLILFIERKNYNSIKVKSKIWYEKVSFHMRRISEMTYAFFSIKYERHSNCGYPELLRYVKLALKKNNIGFSS